MKFSLPNVFGLLAATHGLFAFAAPIKTDNTHNLNISERAPKGEAHLVAIWEEDALARYRFKFQGVSTDNWGQDFLNNIRGWGGVSNNWQCWDNGDGWWIFDNSETIILGDYIMSHAVSEVTGQTCVEIGFSPTVCGAAAKRSLERDAIDHNDTVSTPAPEKRDYHGEAHLVATWEENALARYRFKFQGVSTDNWGQDFLSSIRNHGGVSSNWQCWDNGDGWWIFDSSETLIIGDFIMAHAVSDVTGQSCMEIGFSQEVCSAVTKRALPRNLHSTVGSDEHTSAEAKHAIVAAETLSAPATEKREYHGEAYFVEAWDEWGLRRYRFKFRGVSTDNWGQDFLNAIRSNGGLSSNWQCWDNGDGWWMFDDSEVNGGAGVLILKTAINWVTGQSCNDIGYLC